MLVSESGQVLVMQGRTSGGDQGTKVQMAHVDELRAFLQEAPEEPVMLMPDSLGPGVR